MSAPYPDISLCMIVKDEEECIARCIQSVQSIVSEIIIVDTGSTDRTIEIATSFGARVISRPWDNDFSTPRNISMRDAKGEWILVLDADEAIASRDLKILQEHTLHQNTAYELLQRHYTNDQRVSLFQPCTGEYPEWEQEYGGYFTSNLCRLFPNNPAFEFRNAVHELIEPSIIECTGYTIERSPVPIHHYGHTSNVRAKKKKSSLYTPLGKQKVQEDPNYWKNHFEVAVEYNCNGALLESVIAFRTAAALNPTYTQTWINLGYVLNELGSFPSAIEALSRALALEPSHPEAHCNIAVTYMRLKQLPFAESHLLRALREKPDYTNALCNLGQVYANSNQLDAAETCYRKVLAIFPGNITALTDLGAVLTQQNKPEEAIAVLKQALAIDGSLSRTYYYLGHAYHTNNRLTEAIDTFEQLLSLAITDPAQAPLMEKVSSTCQSWKSEVMSTLQDQ